MKYEQKLSNIHQPNMLIGMLLLTNLSPVSTNEDTALSSAENTEGFLDALQELMGLEMYQLRGVRPFCRIA